MDDFKALGKKIEKEKAENEQKSLEQKESSEQK